MRFLKKIRKGSAVYWAPAGMDIYGSPKFAEPRDLDVRWEDVVENITDAKGAQRVSKARIYAGEPLQPWGVLWKGHMNDLVDPAKPFSNPGASQITRADDIPTIDYKDHLYLVYL